MSFKTFTEYVHELGEQHAIQYMYSLGVEHKIICYYVLLLNLDYTK